MDGLSKANDAFQTVLWPDAELVDVSIGYETLTLRLRESTGQIRRLVCDGYIGYETVGVWDEVVVAEASLSASGLFLDRCIEELDKRLGSNRPPSGSEERNAGAYLELTIVLSDNCQIRVAMSGLRVASQNDAG